MNVYRGCTHGCIYCDSRSKCYQINHDFEDIEVKRNAVEILEAQLKKKRKKCMISTGSMCDPYIHLEEELQVTRKCLEVIERHGFGLSILTKSNRILRDFDLLKAIHKKYKCVVQISLTTYDENLCKILEPNVSTTKDRFEVLKIMHEADIPTVVWLCPTLPFINDTEENLQGILSYCIDAKVNGIVGWGFGMTLREGDREYYYKKLDEHFPGMKQRYIKTFGNSYECKSPNNNKLWEIFKNVCIKNNIFYKSKEVFAFINRVESIAEQIKLF